MTPQEFEIRFNANLPITLIRKPVYQLTYRAGVAGQNLSEVLGFMDSLTLAEALVAKLPDLLQLEQLDYVELTDPDEAEPRVPLYLLALPKSGYLQDIPTIDGDLATELALLTDDQAASLIERFIPRIGLSASQRRNLDVDPDGVSA